jgi:hypothetical protein
MDGASLIDEALAFSCTFAPGNAHVRVGLYCEDPLQSPHVVRFDDVTFDSL